ncbi:40S ribosomal protein S7 [Taphrina deformans PYCC 5710]|uniref:40S ribosomal protein S7 n=1 Tax=Taphrina deformans (strain PYCC 5710 / ATCC 11124 / CBS 356.35 / IMI 108563 / JCM 9778 / NBRC 8474) TaxID=1097556 RepID=R4XCA4_TAPDE|nr:40S ribosomal protein S7 [Taphrina deformans PYCC 5710]|eukprot:CCG83205.1 40S ribosomal protein S7 [Taphrina deformans PYCC 5710]
MAAINKISKQTSDPTELSVAQALYDLETSVADLKADLRPLQISAAREVEVGGGKKAIVIFVPVPLLKSFHKIQQRLTRELEKKFSDRHVVFVAQRRILKKPGRRSRTTQKRPRNRTLTSVHEKILEDLVYPTEIVGKRTRNLVDGRKIQKVYVIAIHRPLSLHPVFRGWQGKSQSCRYVQNWADDNSFSAVYNKLTGKTVVFEFPKQE